MERFTVKFQGETDEGLFNSPCMAVAASEFAEEEAELLDGWQSEAQEDFDRKPPIEVTDSKGNRKLFRITVKSEVSYIPSEVAHV